MLKQELKVVEDTTMMMYAGARKRTTPFRVDEIDVSLNKDEFVDVEVQTGNFRTVISATNQVTTSVTVGGQTGDGRGRLVILPAATAIRITSLKDGTKVLIAHFFTG